MKKIYKLLLLSSILLITLISSSYLVVSSEDVTGSPRESGVGTVSSSSPREPGLETPPSSPREPGLETPPSSPREPGTETPPSSPREPGVIDTPDDSPNDAHNLDIDSEGRDGVRPVEVTTAPVGAIAKTAYSKPSQIPFVALAVLFTTTLVALVTLNIKINSQN